jgi:hypothetical protein
VIIIELDNQSIFLRGREGGREEASKKRKEKRQSKE